MATVNTVRTPGWSIIYKGVNITTRIDPGTLEVDYTSEIAKMAGEMTLRLEDRNRQWQGPWFPTLGDRVSLSIGYEGEGGLVSCGDFQVDTVTLQIPPDVFEMKCLAAFITPAMRTPNTTIYENKSLLQVATIVGNKYGLQVVGAPGDIDVPFAVLSQRQETDLAFLRRLAEDHNYTFTVKGTTLVFYPYNTLMGMPAVLTVDRKDCSRAFFSTKSHETYDSATVSWADPTSKSLITHTLPAAPGTIKTGDSLKISTRVANVSEAALKAEGALAASNRMKDEAELALPGNVKLAAGSNIAITGFAVFNGTYFINKAHHTLSRENGYTTKVELIRALV